MNPNARVEIKKIAENQIFIYQVTVKDDGSETQHKVSINRTDLIRITGGHQNADDIIKKSFDYMLQKVKKEKIPKQLDFTAIGRYFPEFEEEITKIINQ
jgi:hypothetical protein